MPDYREILPSLREAREHIDSGRHREARALLHRLSLDSLHRHNDPGLDALERVIRIFTIDPERGAEVIADLAGAWGAQDRDTALIQLARRSRLRFVVARTGARAS
jgi:hypothetical protein